MRIPKYRRYSLDFKLYAVRKFLRLASKRDSYRVSLRAFSKRFDIPKSTLSRWIRKYTTSRNKSDSLKDHRFGKKPGRNAHLRKITPALRSLVRFHKMNFGLGCWIISDIASECLNASFSHQLIWKIEKEEGLNKKFKRTRYKRFRADAPDDLWQIDLLGPKRLTGGEIYTITITDDYSRYTWVKAFSHPPRESEVLQFLDETIHKEGRQPFAILTDNGAVFGKRFDKWCLLNKRRDKERRKRQERYLKSSTNSPINSWWIMLRYSGILHIKGRPRHPQTQGKVEREHRELNKVIQVCITVEDFEGRLGEMLKILNYYRRVREYRETPARMYGKSEVPELQASVFLTG